MAEKDANSELKRRIKQAFREWDALEKKLEAEWAHQFVKDWTPPHCQRRFREAVLELSRRHAPKQITRYVDEYEHVLSSPPEDDFHMTEFWPPELRPHIAFLRLLKQAGALGPEQGLKLLSGDDTAVGHKVKQGGSKGHLARYGSAEEKKARYASYVETCLEIKDIHPEWRATKIRKEVATFFGVSLRTMEEHTKKIADRLKKVPSK